MRFDELPTEAWNAAAADLDLRDTTDLVALMTAEDATVPPRSSAPARAIAEAIDAVADRLVRGGRLVYVGAGTSGRLALVDAVECESTFAVPPGLVVASSPAAPRARRRHRSTQRTTASQVRREIAAVGVGPLDAVVGLSASGRTPYVCGALDAARSAGALTVALVAVPSPSSGGWSITRSQLSSGPR